MARPKEKRPPKRKKGNKHAGNARRRERKYGPKRNIGGNCGSSFCSPRTGCAPWK